MVTIRCQEPVKGSSVSINSIRHGPFTISEVKVMSVSADLFTISEAKKAFSAGRIGTGLGHPCTANGTVSWEVWVRNHSIAGWSVTQGDDVYLNYNYPRNASHPDRGDGFENGDGSGNGLNNLALARHRAAISQIIQGLKIGQKYCVVFQYIGQVTESARACRYYASSQRQQPQLKHVGCHSLLAVPILAVQRNKGVLDIL